MPAKNEPGKIAVTLAAGTKASGAIEIILDASGSMLQKLGSERRIDIAKKTLTKLTSSTIPAGTPFAFRVFGREVDSCQTDLDVPVGPLNPAAVGQRIAALVAKNGAKTPIGASLDKAADDLKSVTGEKLIVLVTDGEETCGGDPAAAIERLRKAGIGTRVSIVGFALDDEKLATTFRRWSDAGGGAFFDAKDAAGLDKSLTEALRPGFEVVNAQGQVIASGIVGGEAVPAPAGNHTVRIKGRANAAKPVVVKPKETANVAFERLSSCISPKATRLPRWRATAAAPAHRGPALRRQRLRRCCPRTPVPQVAQLVARRRRRPRRASTVRRSRFRLSSRT